MNKRQRWRFTELAKKDPRKARKYWERHIGAFPPDMFLFISQFFDKITVFARTNCWKKRDIAPLYSKLVREYTRRHFTENELYIFWKLLRAGFWPCLVEKWDVFGKNATFTKFKKYLDKLK